MNQSTVFKNWPGGIIEGAFYRTGLFNNSVFIEYIEKNIKDM